jgi:hypothetical protein
MEDYKMSKITEAIKTLEHMLVGERAEIAVKQIEDNLKDRAGFDAVFDGMDKETQEQIHQDLFKIIERVFDA